MPEFRLLTISGSLRAASTNKMLLRAAARVFDPETVTEADIVFPVYDGDLEAKGIPEAVTVLGRQIDAADAVIVSTPEYNKGISGALKNALDWVSRLDGNVWKDKPVAIMSASAGVQGGARGQQMLRHCMNPFAPYVIPMPEVMLGQSTKAFDERGALTNEGTEKLLVPLMDQLRDAARARRG